MQLIKSIIKSIIPEGIFYSTYFIINRFFINRKHYNEINRISKKETLSLEKSINENKLIYVVYDIYSAPITFGDYYYYVLLTRYILSRNIKCKFLIIDTNLNTEWKHYPSFAKIILDEQKTLTNLFLNNPQLEIEHINNKYLKNLQIGENEHYVFKKRVLKRQKTNLFMFSMFNYLKIEKPYHFLLKKDEFKSNHQSFSNLLTKEYITFNFRFNKSYGADRNTSKVDANKIINSLSKVFNNHKIVIVSDKEGCDYFKNSINYDSEKILFSKDLGETFVDDIALIANSQFYFQHIGGGLGFIISTITDLKQFQNWRNYGRNEKIYKFTKPFFWLNENQNIYINKSLDWILNKFEEKYYES